MPQAYGPDDRNTRYAPNTSFGTAASRDRNQQEELYDRMADILSDPELTTSSAKTQEQGKTAVPGHSINERVWDYLGSRFNQDNWFGSLATGASFYTYLETLRAAKSRKENGVPTLDYGRALSAIIFMAEKTWSFFSIRGGKFPEGDTIPKRAVNAIRHPQKSSTQFEWLFLFPARCASIYAAATTGLRAHGIGLKEGKVPYKQEKIRLYLAIVQTISTFLTGLGHFRKRGNETPEGEENKTLPENLQEGDITGNKQRNIFRVIGQIWKYDKLLFIGSTISTLLPAMEGVEGWIKSTKSRKEANHLIKAGVISTLIGAAYTAYTFQRIERSNYRKHNAEINDTSDAAPSRETRNIPFTQRLENQQPALARSY